MLCALCGRAKQREVNMQPYQILEATSLGAGTYRAWEQGNVLHVYLFKHLTLMFVEEEGDHLTGRAPLLPAK